MRALSLIKREQPQTKKADCIDRLKPSGGCFSSPLSQTFGKWTNVFSLVRTVPIWGEILTDHPLKFDIWDGGAYMEQIWPRNNGFGFQTKCVGESIKFLNVKCNLK